MICPNCGFLFSLPSDVDDGSLVFCPACETNFVAVRIRGLFQLEEVPLEYLYEDEE